MDILLKQHWRDQLQHDQSDSQDQQQHPPSAKFPRLLQLEPPPSGSSSALPLFEPEPTAKLISTNSLSEFPPDHSTSPARFPRMMMGSGYFSMAQWQELEVQALIFRHMLAGAAIPPQLLHLLKKSFLISPTNPHHPYMVQSGYWGKGAMDPEPGRCRRTDGKKWRCSREVMAGHKYCERHMHRGRHRSRKPVEIATPTTPTAGGGISSSGGGVLQTNTNPIAAMAAGGSHFSLSEPSPSFDLLNLKQRPSESVYERKDIFRTRIELSEEGKSGGQILRQFFDDWPRSLQESDNSGSNTSSVTSATSLSISTPANPPSDFSLKLSTGNEEKSGSQDGYLEGERAELNWGTAWGSNQVASMGGPLAEALRSSTSSSSPTSVLHQLRRGSTSEASYVRT
ncbi:hypothetical protein RJ640_030948 [Escallonia rubra]|uniref:Growth-regulating factor n=1 Tax=Escallonia rubra TaxID=112253 RepID=A0AA88U4V0_9ASTE|nr:hypothetical protein RJ640_030948 [Escallonia rubra]